MKIIKLSLITFTLLSTTIFAEESFMDATNPFYVGASLDLNKYKDFRKMNSFSLLAGYDFNNYLGVETRYSSALNSKNYDFKDISVYLKPQYGIYNFNFYSLLGYGILSDNNSFKWGAGIEYSFTKDFDIPVNIYMDYTDFYNKEDTTYDDFSSSDKTNSLNIGFKYSF